MGLLGARPLGDREAFPLLPYFFKLFKLNLVIEFMGLLILNLIGLCGKGHLHLSRLCLHDHPVILHIAPEMIGVRPLACE